MKEIGAECISCELSEVAALLECLAIYIGAAAEVPPDIDCVRGETIRAALYGVSNYIERLQVDLDEYSDDREHYIRTLRKKLQDQAEKLPTKEGAANE